MSTPFTVECESGKSTKIEIPEGQQALIEKAELYNVKPEFPKEPVIVELQLTYLTYVDDQQEKTQEEIETNELIKFRSKKEKENIDAPISYENKPVIIVKGPGSVKISGIFLAEAGEEEDIMNEEEEEEKKSK